MTVSFDRQQQEVQAVQCDSTQSINNEDSSESQVQVSSDNTNLSELLNRSKGRLLKRIPKASRLNAADKLRSLLSAVNNDPDNVSLWHHS